MMLSDEIIRLSLNQMCMRATERPISTKWFDISHLLTTDEWEATKGYGHITLGQHFKAFVENGKVERVRCCARQPKGKRNRYEKFK